ncbi:MAG: adenosylcobinamide-GDP ribazoletransferase [Rhodospirillaceae bacterium]|nr:adenosylcobinamide-GDP ribazoletransferase [Rhodospirillaceae bacterium]|tara:strand:- start:277 stop:1065 length:789 start_codon:yes stop_codon:yes gene_type:complete
MTKFFDKIRINLWKNDLLMALGFLTRIPVPYHENHDRLLMSAGWCFPIIGSMIGYAGGLLLWLLLVLNVPTLVASFLTIGALAFLTGGLHEDGLADTFDGFGAGTNKKTIVTIMRDPQIGTFGTLALIIFCGIKAISIATLADNSKIFLSIAALVSAHALSRFLFLPVCYFFDSASHTGVAKFAGRPEQGTLYVAFFVTSVILITLLPFSEAIFVTCFVATTTYFFALMVRRRIGGYTGDTLGAGQQISETITLVYLASISN